MEHSLSENVFECKYTPYREIRPNNFAFAQGAQARHPSARKSGRNSLDELPINSRNIVCIRKFEQQPSFAYLCALVLSAQFYAELLPSLRYSTFPCECFRLTCPVYALRARIRTKHWETACSLDFSRGIQITRSVWMEASLLTARRSPLKGSGSSYACPKGKRRCDTVFCLMVQCETRRAYIGRDISIGASSLRCVVLRKQRHAF